MISILNFVFTVVFYVMRRTKLDIACIYFEEFICGALASDEVKWRRG
jgi:hypothetical protein